MVRDSSTGWSYRAVRLDCGTLTFLRCPSQWLGKDGRAAQMAGHHSAGTASLFAATGGRDDEQEERGRLMTHTKCVNMNIIKIWSPKALFSVQLMSSDHFD